MFAIIFIMHKNILVIGSNGLLGREILTSLQNKGHQVTGSDLITSEHASLKIDINDSNSIQQSIDQLKPIDVVINLAYPRNKEYGKKLEDVTYTSFTKNIQLHLGGYFLVMKMFAELFTAQGHGKIISFSSIYGLIAPRFEIYDNTSMTMPVEYAAVKSAIIHLTKYFAKYYKKKNIQFICVSPGGIENNQDASFIKGYNSYALGKGMLKKDALNGLMGFLVSDEANGLNGHTIIFDEGWSL